MIKNVHAHPEWKRLFAAMKDLLEHDQSWTYDELNELAGTDIRTPHGRSQFTRFRKEVRTVLNFHFEVERMKGYRVVHANEHVTCALNRHTRAKRRIAESVHILSHVHAEQLTDVERRINTDALARSAGLLVSITKEQSSIRKNINAVQRGELPPKLLLGQE
jgi:hypothetical protein